MKADKNLIEKLDKFVTALLEDTTSGNQSVGADGVAMPPIEIADRVRVLASVTNYLAIKNRIDIDEDEGGGIGDIVSQLRGAETKSRARRQPSSRVQVGPGADTIPVRDRFGPGSGPREVNVEAPAPTEQ